MSFINKSFLITAFVFLYLSYTHSQAPGNGVTDIDGNNYPTTTYGSIEVMAENLKTSRFANGDFIPNVTDFSVWSNLSSGAWCNFSNDPANDSVYGKLYNGFVVDDSRNVCPAGWHVLDQSEWNDIKNRVGANPGGAMKSTGLSYWQSPNTGATNTANFNGKGGGRRSSTLDFFNFNEDGRWWTATPANSVAVYEVILFYNNTSMTTSSASNRKNGYAIRCANDSTVITHVEIPAKQQKTLIKVIDFMGRETELKPYTPLILIYSDGTYEKIIQLK